MVSCWGNYVYATDPGQCDGWYAMWEDYGDQDMCIGEACFDAYSYDKVACEYACGGLLQTCREILEDNTNIEGGGDDAGNEAICGAGQFSMDGVCYGCPSGYYQPESDYSEALCQKCPEYVELPSAPVGSYNNGAYVIDGWDYAGAVGSWDITQCYVMGNSSAVFSDKTGTYTISIAAVGATVLPGYDDENEDTFCLYEDK